MASARHEVRIARPPEEVFAFLADGANNPSWQPPVSETTRVGGDGPVAVGSAFRQRMRHPLGFTVGADYRVTVFDPSRALATVVTSGGPLRPTLAYELRAEEDGGTLVRATVSYRPGGIARLAAPALALLHPLFAWESAWIEHARDVLERR